MANVMTSADLSPADWEALLELRQRQMIRVDHAGQHAASLDRLQAADAIGHGSYSTDVADDTVSADQLALGFERSMGGQRADRRLYCAAPHWIWPTTSLDAGAPALLREHEGRKAAVIDWDEFCSYVVWSFGQRGDYPTMAMVARSFGHTVEDVVDWIDDQYWAARIGPGELAEQKAWLEGE